MTSLTASDHLESIATVREVADSERRKQAPEGALKLSTDGKTAVRKAQAKLQSDAGAAKSAEIETAERSKALFENLTHKVQKISAYYRGKLDGVREIEELVLGGELQNAYHKPEAARPLSSRLWDFTSGSSGGCRHQHLKEDPERVEEWHCQDITDVHINNLQKSAAAMRWQRIARKLHKENRPGRPKAFSESDLSGILKQNPDDDRECLRVMINAWVLMSTRHTAGFLYEALDDEGLGRPAEETFGLRPN